MNKKFTERAIIRKQGDIIRSYRSFINELISEAKKTIEYCQKNGYKESRIANLIIEKSDPILFHHDLIASKIEELRKGMTKSQTQIISKPIINRD